MGLATPLSGLDFAALAAYFAVVPGAGAWHLVLGTGEWVLGAGVG